MQTNNQIEGARWSSEAITAFWDYVGEKESLHWEYFSNQFGHGIAAFLSHTGKLKPGVVLLDYGCGPGFLIGHLLKREICCYGLDSSSKSVEMVNRKYANNKFFEGAVVESNSAVPIPASSFDVVTCIETIEHIPEDAAHAVVSDIFRLLKPGGVALFTTPYKEDLDNNTIRCPFCLKEYHRYEHLRSLDTPWLNELLLSHGFKVVFSNNLDLGRFQSSAPGLFDLSCRQLWWEIRKGFLTLSDRVLGRRFPNGRAFNFLLKPGPHLCAIVERPD